MSQADVDDMLAKADLDMKNSGIHAFHKLYVIHARKPRVATKDGLEKTDENVKISVQDQQVAAAKASA